MRSAILATICAGSILPSSALPVGGQRNTPEERRVAVDKASLFVRMVGQGPPIIVLHGGPDFDHTYFLPDLDRLADRYRLVYYDQRGRGKSAEGVQPADVTMASEMADLDRIRESLQLGSAAVLGHSWGTLLALEYAVRHPDRVSQLILLNPAPASAADFAYFRKVYAAKLGDDLARLRAAASTPGYKEADAEAVADYYRIHFKAALTRPEHVETIVARLKATFTKDAVLKARAVEERLYKETWLQDGYDLLPKLAALKIPTLVVYSEHDFIPPESALHIAEATPDARVVALKTCGHFSFFDCPNEVRDAIDGLFRGR